MNLFMLWQRIIWVNSSQMRVFVKSGFAIKNNVEHDDKISRQFTCRSSQPIMFWNVKDNVVYKFAAVTMIIHRGFDETVCSL